MNTDVKRKIFIPLSAGEMGKSYKVLESNVEEKIESRLEALGINEDTIIRVINKKRCGTMIIKVRGTRFALGSRISKDIVVEELQNENQ